MLFSRKKQVQIHPTKSLNSCMFKIMKKEAPDYLINLISEYCRSITTRNELYYQPTTVWQIVSSVLFSHYIKWEVNIRDSELVPLFKGRFIYFALTVQSNTYNIFEPKGLKFQILLRLGLSQLNEYIFWYSMNSLCSCSLEVQDTSHYHLQCHYFYH